MKTAATVKASSPTPAWQPPQAARALQASALPNRATGRLLIQRACACGGRCAECREEGEREAGIIQRLAAGSSRVDGPLLRGLLQRSAGQPLHPGARAQFEPRFGADFSGVRVHTDAAAADAARHLSAHAFTTGQDIYFAPGRYQPHSAAGQRLLAHELTHTLQQRGRAPGPQGQYTLDTPGDPYEREAERVAEAVVRDRPASVSPSSATLVPHRSFADDPWSTITVAAGVGGVVAAGESAAAAGAAAVAGGAAEPGEGIALVAGGPAGGPRRPAGAGFVCETDVTKFPAGLPCVAVTGPGHPAGTDFEFDLSSAKLSKPQRKVIAAFASAWLARGGTEPITVDGYASCDGPQVTNWKLSCDRAEAVKTELAAAGVPKGMITTFAHGESQEFSKTALKPNRRAILSTLPPPAPKCGPPPACPIGGTAPELRNPGIPSGALCRGACGPDCPPTCTAQPNVRVCIPDSTGTCHFICEYASVIECGSHAGCRTHDACYDACAAADEHDLCPLGTCHCACDLGCIRAHGLRQCNEWRTGRGPFDRMILYSDPPTRTGPHTGPCPP